MILEIIILIIVSLNLLLNLIGILNQSETADKRWDSLFTYLQNNEKDRLEIINDTIPDLQNDLNVIKSLVR